MLAEDTTSRFKLMMTDGVFSMEGEEADLVELVRICGEKDVLLAVDDSHATGVLGATGRGTAEEQGVYGQDRRHDRHARQGHGLGRRRLHHGSEGPRRDAPPAEPDLPLLQLAAAGRRRGIARGLPDAAGGSGAGPKAPRQRRLLPQGDLGGGLPDPHGTHPIVPVIVGDTAKALAMGKALFEEGVYVSGFGFPVVPQGQARLRCQVSAAHERSDLDRAVDAFRKVGKKFEVI